MSMIAYLQAISPQLVTAVSANPGLLETLIDPGDPPPEQQELLTTATDALEIGKDWHGIHYLLCGQAWETPGILGQVILGGTEIGEDLGYGPARLHTPEMVVTLAQALSGFPVSQFIAKFDPDQLNAAAIYPDGWGLEDREGLANSYQAVVDYYQKAATQGLGMLLYLL